MHSKVSFHPKMKIAIVFLFSLAAFSPFTQANLMLCALLGECENDDTPGVRLESRGKTKRLNCRCSRPSNIYEKITGKPQYIQFKK